MTQALGRLEAVLVRDVWTHEANDFTPWLAQDANMALLGETLGLGPLEVEATERSVGRFSADIVAKDETGNYVLIENQLEPTDHRHLGQLLTYLAGLEGDATVIWIATQFLEEHRAAIDWLNSNTTDRFDFFGVELELFRIGQSVPAPRFNIVAKPNDWSRSVRSAARAISETALNDTQRFYQDYWQGFIEYLRKQNYPQRATVPSKSNSMGFGFGQRGFYLVPRIFPDQGRLSVELSIGHPIPTAAAKSAFRQLQQDAHEFDRAFGATLQWQELPSRASSTISVSQTGFNIKSDADRSAQYDWLREQMVTFRRVFTERARALNLEAGVEDGAPGEANGVQL